MSSEFNLEEWRDSLNKVKYTKQWQKTLLETLHEDEMIENYPSTDGLYRLAGMLCGDLSTEISVTKSPTNHDRSATVIVRVISDKVAFEGAADVYENNTKAPYNKHPVATAETKAFGRALKKLLMLNVHTKEEMADDETSYEKISEQQVRATENIAKKLGVDIEKFLAEHAGVNLELFRSGQSGLTKDHGVTLLTKLNELQNSTTS